MSVSLSTILNGYQSFLANGLPNAGGSIYTYLAGTTTSATTYMNNLGTIPNANPIPLSIGGTPPSEIWLTDGIAYKFVIVDAFGAQVPNGTFDNVTGSGPGALAASTGSSQVGNGAETVAQSFNALQLADFAAVRAYTGPRKSIYVTGYLGAAAPSGISGMFVRDDSDVTTADNGGTVLVAGAVRWKRQYDGRVDVQWFGAKLDNVADDAPAYQACINYAQPLGKVIYHPAGIAKLLSQLTVAGAERGLNLEGEGWIKSRINYSAVTGGIAGILITGTPGSNCGALIEGIGFDGNSTSIAIELRGQCGQRMRRCQFHLNSIGIRFHNFASGQFTEINVADGCDFTISCQTALHYKVTSGNASFHGSGMVNRCMVNTPLVPTGGTIIVDAGAYPYNCPIEAQFWVNASTTIIQSANTGSTFRPFFIGTMTLEVFAGTATLATAPTAAEIPFIGKVASSSTNITFGALFMCDTIASAASGSRQIIGAKSNKSLSLTTGANTVTTMPYNIIEGCILYVLHISAANYDYRYLVSAYAGSTGGAAPIIATYSTFNTAGYGAPTFTVNASHQLVITNAAYPASGVTATLEAVQIGQSIFTAFIN